MEYDELVSLSLSQVSDTAITSNGKSSLHSLYATIQKGGFEMEREMEKMNSADLCYRAPIITALGMGPAQGSQ